MPHDGHINPGELEARLERLEQQFRHLKAAAVVVAAVLLSLLVPPVRAVLGLCLLVLAVVVPVLLLIRVVMWLLDRASGGHAR